MKNNVHNQLVKQKYTTLYQRITKALETGKFYTYTNAKKQAIFNRLKRYENRLKRWGIAVVSAAALFVTPMTVQAQTAPTGSEFQVNTYTTNNQAYPVVAMDNDGDFVITWQSNQDGSYYGIYAQQYDNAGATVGGEVHVSTTTINKQEEPAIAMDNDGDFIIAWADQGVYNYSTYTYDPGQDGDGSGIYAQRFGTFVLPVELTDFTVQTQDNQTNLLLWQTATEENNKGFEVQKSMNGQDFETIDFVEGKGMTMESQNYTFTDEKPNNGINYYRLKQIDFDGQFEYSKVISVNVNGAIATIGEFYPNPSESGFVNLNYFAQNDNEITIAVFDMTGKLMISQTQQILNGNNNLSFDFSDLNTGIYIVKIGDNIDPIHRRLIVEK